MVDDSDFDVQMDVANLALLASPPPPTTIIRTPPRQDIGEALERVLIEGDLNRLSPEQRVEYYRNVCESMGLNPLTRPLDYIRLNGKLVLYANKNCGEQLRRVHGVSIFKLERDGGVETYDVTAYARNAEGREDAALGSVSIKGLAGENLSNAKMKAETKAKRRVTLSLCGLGMLDETEVETIPGARKLEEASATALPPPAPIGPPEGSQGPTKRRGRPPGAKNKPAPVQPPLPIDDPQVEPVVNPNQRFIDACAKEASRIGRELYMEALGAYGYERIEDIRDPDMAKQRDIQMTFYKTLQTLNPIPKGESNA